MQKLAVISLLLWSQFAAADLLDALKAYENKDFSKASQEFGALLPLANEQAAFNLGAMAYNGEGQASNPVKALAYFQFAAAHGHDEAKTLAEKLQPTLTAAQQQQAESLLLQLQQQIKINPDAPAVVAAIADNDHRPAVKRYPPMYPKEAAARGAIGTVTMRLLVNEQGDVEAVDVLNAFPKGVFEHEAIRTLKRWKYEPGPNKFVGRVLLTFQLGDVDQRKVQRIFNEYKLWEYSALGSPVHQNALANILDLARNQSMFTQYVDKSLSPALGPLSPDFVKNGKVVSNNLTLPAGFSEDAFISVDESGRVTAVAEDNKELVAKLQASLLGQQLTTDKIPAGFYKLDCRQGKKAPRLLTAQRIPQTYSDDYWMEQAARGGNIEAQRALAALRPEWELYLLEQQDPVVQSWAGTQLILNGKKAEGEKLLDAAIAKGHTTAKELKAAL